MKKLLAILFLIMTVQGIAETVVRGTLWNKKEKICWINWNIWKRNILKLCFTRW